ncbi:MAG: GMC oxidoreductase, partial [Acidobacteria bacterium]|nr:GMC oxidoreductase [Acidobacteriota bacterium]
ALIRGIRIARDLAATRALRGFPLAAEVMPGSDLRTDAELATYIRATAETCYHPAGTCAMGAVVDAELRLLGLEGLRVADASVMPELVNGNTLAATVMIAEKAAALIKTAT